MKKRLPAIDWMRGIVMILMATDHASGAYNSGRLFTDSALMYTAGMPLPLHMQEGLLVSTIAMTVGLVVLYPVCRWYRGFKAKHAGTVLRYM